MPSDCPTDSSCRTVTLPMNTLSLCLPDCCAGDACGTGLGCSDAFVGIFPVDGDSCLPADVAAGDGDPCVEFADCSVSSICLDDPFEQPGGQCATVGCTVFDDTTCAAGGDGRCIDVDGVGRRQPFCVDVCDANTDCREAEGYTCFDGTAINLGKFCRHPETGDPCAADGDCGVAPWTCRTAAEFTNGYCTIDNCTPGDPTTCASGAVCYDPTGAPLPYCAERCTPGSPMACRTGYTCGPIAGGNSPNACLPN
jgi:hypothetical protein